MIGSALNGWSGFLMAYAAAQVPMIAGLIKGRAALHHYPLSPLVAAPLTAIAAAGASIVGAHGMAHFAITAAASAFLGYAGGRATAREEADRRIHQRGSLIAEAPAHRPSRSKSPEAEAGITLAGVAIPLQLD